MYKHSEGPGWTRVTFPRLNQANINGNINASLSLTLANFVNKIVTS